MTFSRRLWIILFALALVAAACLAATGLRFDPSSAAPVGLIVIGLQTTVYFYRNKRDEERIATALESVSQLLIFSAIGMVLSYEAARCDMPLQDAAFFALDRAFGFHWRVYLGYVEGRPILSAAYAVAYQSLEAQIIVILLTLSYSGRLEDCRRFVITFILAALSTIAVSGLFPAVGNYLFLGLDKGTEFSRVAVSAGIAPAQTMLALRSGVTRLISLRNAQGIIMFPSLHAALGLLFARTLWRIRLLRWPGLALNAALIASAPIYGGHYLVDLLSGALIAVLSILATGALFRAQKAQPRALPLDAPKQQKVA